MIVVAGPAVGISVGGFMSVEQHASTQPSGTEVEPALQSLAQKSTPAGGSPSSSHAAVHEPGRYGPPSGQIIRHIDGLIGPGLPSGQGVVSGSTGVKVGNLSGDTVGIS